VLWRTAEATVVVLSVLSASGCILTASPETAPGQTSQSGIVSLSDSVDFTGPWRAEFSANYETVTTSLARGILADGVIDAAEVAEMNEALIACVEGLGAPDVEIDPYGAVRYAFPLHLKTTDEQTAFRSQATECESTTDWDRVVPLSVDIQRSPDKEDVSGAVAECLVQAGLRPSGYSVEDYRAEHDSSDGFSEFALDSPEYAVFYACQMDPLAVLETE
jgi:hypothetical protein